MKHKGGYFSFKQLYEIEILENINLGGHSWLFLFHSTPAQ